MMPSDPLFYVVAGVIAASALWKFFSTRKPKVYEDVEREAELQLLSHDPIALINWTRAKSPYLLPETYKKLLMRIQELKSDKEYYDNMVKSKIDSL